MWLGQTISLIGSGLTAFALSVWIYQQTGSVTQLALVNLSFHLGIVALSPLAGPLVDRWDRRWVIIWSDTGAALVTLFVALLWYSGRLELWHIYLAVFSGAAFRACQWPAYSAVVPVLVSNQQLGQANGLVQLGRGLGEVAAPVLAGGLIGSIGLGGVILVDFATFMLAVVSLLLVKIPRPERKKAREMKPETWWREAGYGWRYIRSQPGLLAMLLFMTAMSFNYGLATILFTPYVLSFASPVALGGIVSAGSIGILAGSLIMSAWGGPRHRIYTVVGPGLLLSLGLVLIGSRSHVVWVTGAVFMALLGVPVMLGSVESIWQVKVIPEAQGRVFAARNMVVEASPLLSMILAGPLADRLFEPLLRPGGVLANTLGQVIGVGEGRGIGLLFIALGAFTFLLTVLGWSYPRLRLIEEELPDTIISLPEQAPALTKAPQEAA